MSTRATKSGLSRDMQIKLNNKYDEELAAQCLLWVQEVIEASGQESDFNCDGSQDNFHAALKDGLVLGRLTNALMPASIPAAKLKTAPKLAFKQMELIALFVSKAKEFGVPDTEAFQTVDLFESQNLHQVVMCLQSLSRKAKAKGMLGFGPKEAEANRRVFTVDQLKAGQNVIGLQMGTNKGASQAGMTFGKQRMIID